MTAISKAQVKMVRSLQVKKFRDELGLFVAEGQKCVEELRKGFEMVLLATPDNASEKDLKQMSGMKTPSDYIGVFKKTAADRPLPLSDRYAVRSETADAVRSETADAVSDRIIVALDGVQDPGNLGTIIRTCDWFGVRDLVCSPDTADCYNPKVVQATMGALTRVRVYYAELVPWLQGLKADSQIPIYGTLLEGVNMYAGDPIREGVIVMGNEGKGISQAVRAMITHPIRIPSYPEGAETSESLNVAIATAVVLAKAREEDKR